MLPGVGSEAIFTASDLEVLEPQELLATTLISPDAAPQGKFTVIELLP